LSIKPETLFRQRVIRDLTLLPFTVIFSIQQRTIKGDPDLFLCIRGMFIAIELKSINGKATKLQLYKLEKIREALGRGYVAFPDNWDEILTELNELARGIV
jgi:hypothetical protein